MLGLPVVLDVNEWSVVVSRNDPKRPSVLNVELHTSIRDLAANQTFGVKDSVANIEGILELGSEHNKALVSCGKADAGRSRAVTATVLLVLPNSDAAVCTA